VGKEADVIAVAGDALADIKATEKVVFVMRAAPSIGMRPRLPLRSLSAPRAATAAMAAAASLLVVLDLARPYAGPGLRPGQWGGGFCSRWPRSRPRCAGARAACARTGRPWPWPRSSAGTGWPKISWAVSPSHVVGLIGPSQ